MIREPCFEVDENAATSWPGDDAAANSKLAINTPLIVDAAANSKLENQHPIVDDASLEIEQWRKDYR